MPPPSRRTSICVAPASRLFSKKFLDDRGRPFHDFAGRDLADQFSSRGRMGDRMASVFMRTHYRNRVGTVVGTSPAYDPRASLVPFSPYATSHCR